MAAFLLLVNIGILCNHQNQNNMKKLLILSLGSALLLACGGKSQNGKALGEELCECYKKANGMDAADPKRAAAQADCLKKQGDVWNKVKDDPKEADDYNKVIGACASEQIKKSFGQ